MTDRATALGAFLTSAFVTLAACAPASAADYPLKHKRVVRAAAVAVVVPVEPACYRGRWTYANYLPVLATEPWPRSVYIEYPVPCAR